MRYLLAGLVWLLGANAFADDRVCAPPLEVPDPLHTLRALSLDLRGQLPTAEEVERVAELGGVPEAFLDEWLGSEAFVREAVRHHRSLLWNNVGDVRLSSANARLQRVNSIYWRRNAAQVQRGATVPCLDEPARYDAEGGIVTRLVDGYLVEGWVEVAPYWDPENPIRVCAFDAQTARYSAEGSDCATAGGHRDPGCGCGPDLRWCTYGDVDLQITRAMSEAVDRLVGALVSEGAPYTELFESRRAWVNGPLVHFWRHQAKVSGNYAIEPVPLEADRLPELAFTDVDTWVEVQLPAAHAGVLTRAGFLLRFQTNRARANRFYDAFLCQPFQPPDGGLAAGDEEAALDPDLQKRAGCRYCHALLEPAAAHWGRWAEQGVGYLAPTEFPAERADCTECARTGSNCSRECRQFYLTRAFSEAEERWLGMLNAYAFRRPDHVRNIEHGPRLLALSAVADHRLPRCVAQKTAEWLLGRALEVDDRAWLDGLATEFVAEGYQYTELVRDIVTSERYRRVR